jgi:DNA-directed RNA polymerase subunit E'/Rpb7
MKTILLAAIFLPILAFANDKPPKTYPIHGSVIAVHVGTVSRGGGVYTDPYGKTHGGGTVNHETHTYRIETDTLVYELTERSKKPRFSVGDSVEFRIEKEKAYVQEGDKERKYDITGTEQKPPTQVKAP